MTVLFADIRNSTSLVDLLDPEMAMQRLQPVLHCMREAVERYDGIVSRTQGDGIMAFFGAPRPHEDHAVRACLAALEMQEAVKRLCDPQMQIRVGAHTGEVVVQAVNNTLYRTYDASGANVHLASRMEGLAQSGEIVISGETHAACKQFVKAQSLGLKSVHGFSAPVEVFKVITVRHAPASELFRRREHLSPLTGRADALQVLETELTETVTGNGRVVGVVGEPGVGKSRLCFEFVESCRRRGIRVYEARVLAYGHATPLHPVLELLRDFFGIKGTESADEARPRVTRALQSLRADDKDAALLLDFLGLRDAADVAPKLDPVVRKMRLLAFIGEIARSRPRAQATVVLIEDAHWIDPASAEFVERLADAVVGTRTLLLLNFRWGVASRWMQRSHYRQIALGPLDSGAADDLLASLLGRDDLLSALYKAIAERAQGNPFFMEELVNSLLQRGDVAGRWGALRLAQPGGNIPLPSTVEAVLAARIDRLDEKARDVLQSAAVIGREVPVGIFEQVANLPPQVTNEALWQLRQAELLHQLPAKDGAVHAFRHPLVREVAYGSLLHGRRKKLHRSVAQAIEAQSKTPQGEHAALLAYHLEQGGDLLQAAQANLRAAIWVGANDASQALRSWRKVLELLADQPRSQTTDYLRMFACGQIMNFGWREGMRAQEADGFFEKGRELAIAVGSARANALIHAAYGRILAATGSADKYVQKITEAEALVANANDLSMEVTLKAVRCHALRLAGRTREALDSNIEATTQAHKIVEFDRQLLGFDVELWLTVMRGQVLVTLGRFDEARPCLDRLLQLDPDRGDLTHHVASVTYVDMAWALGDVPLAEHHAARAFSIALKGGSPYVRVHAQAARGLAHMVAGRPDRAAEDLIEALSFARERKAGLEIEARILADLAHARYAAKDLDGAWRAAYEATEIGRLRCNRVPLCLAHIVRAEVLGAIGDGAGAYAELGSAESMIAETGAEVYEPLARRLRANLASRRQLPVDAGAV